MADEDEPVFDRVIVYSLQESQFLLVEGDHWLFPEFVHLALDTDGVLALEDRKEHVLELFPRRQMLENLGLAVPLDMEDVLIFALVEEGK